VTKKLNWIVGRNSHAYHLHPRPRHLRNLRDPQLQGIVMPFTPQELFDQSYAGIVAQGDFGYDPQIASCRYRTKTGLKCAIGVLIPDEKYDPKMDLSRHGTAIDMSDPRSGGALVRAALEMTNYDETRGVAAMLQRAHDYAAMEKRNKWSDWRRRLIAIAQHLGLDASHVQKDEDEDNLP
jgi:hypothetical protein